MGTKQTQSNFMSYERQNSAQPNNVARCWALIRGSLAAALAPPYRVSPTPTSEQKEYYQNNHDCFHVLTSLARRSGLALKRQSHFFPTHDPMYWPERLSAHFGPTRAECSGFAFEDCSSRLLLGATILRRVISRQELRALRQTVQWWRTDVRF
jgi:hypothetical protein